MRKILYYWPMLTFLISFPALPWKLLVIQSVSDSGQTFTTQTQAGMDRLLGQRGTFIVNNASIVAEAIEINDFYTRWRLKDPLAKAPFSRGLAVTFHPSPQAVWPRVSKRRKKKTYDFGKHPDDVAFEKAFQRALDIVEGRDPDREFSLVERSWQLRLHGGFGLTESVSGVPGDLEGNRSLLQGEFSYVREILRNFRWSLGLRLDREINEIAMLTVYSHRQYLSFGMGFHPIGTNFRLPDLFPKKTLSPYLGLSLGLGYSSGQLGGLSQSGVSFVLPHIWAGLEAPLTPPWSLGLEVALESIVSHEKISGAPTQKISQTNAKMGITFRYRPQTE